MINGQHIVAVVGDARLLNSRYPEAVWSGPARMAIQAGRAENLAKPEVSGGIIDEVDVDEVLYALRSDKPLLLSPESLAALTREGSETTTTLLERDWIPLLPVSLSAEVLAAAEILRSGNLGQIRSCHLTTCVGPVIAEAWEQDAPFARSFFEATVLGLDLLSTLFHAPVSSTRWLMADTSTNFGVAVHEISAHTAAVQEIMPSHLAASPLFTATVHCDDGRILLREEFAPGGTTVWEATSRSFRCLILPREKPNVQASDSVRGGIETSVLIAALASGERDGLPTRDHALEIVRHAVAYGATDSAKAQNEAGEGT